MGSLQSSRTWPIMAPNRPFLPAKRRLRLMAARSRASLIPASNPFLVLLRDSQDMALSRRLRATDRHRAVKAKHHLRVMGPFLGNLERLRGLQAMELH